MGLVTRMRTNEHRLLLWQIWRAFSYDQNAANWPLLQAPIEFVLF